MFKKILLGLLAIFIVMQIFSIDKSNPPVDPSKDFLSTQNIPDDVMTILKHACMDCHSHYTRYPWYTNLEPFSWYVKGHIKHGRGKLNFSEWGDYDEEDKSYLLHECEEVLKEKRMPLASYMIAHPKARITQENRNELIKFFNSL